MSNPPGPWSNQPADPATPAPGPGWAQPGPTNPGPPVYGPVPTHYSSGYTTPPPAYGPPPGQPTAPGYPPAPGYPTVPGYGPPPALGYAMPLRTDYAGWGKRVGAMLIDQLPTYIGLIIFYVGYFLWLFRFSASASTGGVDLAGGVLPMIVGFAIMLAGFGWTIYNRWLVAGRTGQSLGKRVTKIRLVSELTDAPIGPANAFVRDLVHILDGMAYVGYLWPLWDDKRQTFADKIVRTVVVTAR
jgi:uncharacterized RDD family membrane protein YckC